MKVFSDTNGTRWLALALPEDAGSDSRIVAAPFAPLAVAPGVRIFKMILLIVLLVFSGLVKSTLTQLLPLVVAAWSLWVFNFSFRTMPPGQPGAIGSAEKPPLFVYIGALLTIIFLVVGILLVAQRAAVLPAEALPVQLGLFVVAFLGAYFVLRKTLPVTKVKT
jgi:hypothetical protein